MIRHYRLRDDYLHSVAEEVKVIHQRAYLNATDIRLAKLFQNVHDQVLAVVYFVGSFAELSFGLLAACFPGARRCFAAD